MSDISLPGLHQVEVGGVVLLIHQQLVHTNDTCCDSDHGQSRLPGLLLVAHIQLRMQLLCKALQVCNTMSALESSMLSASLQQASGFAALPLVWQLGSKLYSVQCKNS